MTSTWPRWLPRQSHLEKFKFTILAGQVHFWCKCNRYKPVTFKITCQSSQGHLLSRKSIDFSKALFLSHWKGQGQSFKCKLTEFVSWNFKYFWFQCKVNGKFGIWSPMSSYMHCKGTQNWIFGSNLSFHRNFKSYHTSTGSHMFSFVKGHIVTLPWCVPTMQASSPSTNPGTQQFTDGSQLCWLWAPRNWSDPSLPTDYTLGGWPQWLSTTPE